jgi:extracellular matrix regulatory protein A
MESGLHTLPEFLNAVQQSNTARGRSKMSLRLINIGFGNVVSATRIISIVSPESAPIKRIITVARDANKLVDATYGRRTRAVIITDSDHVILSAVQPETVGQRVLRDDELSEE